MLLDAIFIIIVNNNKLLRLDYTYVYKTSLDFFGKITLCLPIAKNILF